MKYRIEKDSLGELKVPAGVLYGVQTARAVQNFPISGQTAFPSFIWATVLIKRGAAEVNAELGMIPADKADAIAKAADEILSGKHHDQFIVDVFQAGAGTSHHMNVNEVIANRAEEILGGNRGEYVYVHPNDHVNFGQSTNDVFPTAMRLAILQDHLLLSDSLEGLVQALHKKEEEFSRVIKAGRTHLQDAVPVTLGQEFGAYAAVFNKMKSTVEEAANGLRILGIGGSAAGTGLNTHPEYRRRLIDLLSHLSGFPLYPAENLFAAMQSMAPFTGYSGALKETAAELIKLANDLRLLGSGPTTGLSEISLPPVQPGSSIMPGKVNPVMAEEMNMAAFQVVGNDTAVTLAAQAGQLELNVMMPVIIYNILFSLKILTNSITAFTDKCIVGITANTDRCNAFFAASMGLATVLNTVIGYQQAAEIVKEAVRTKAPILDIIRKKGILKKEQIETVFAPDNITVPGVLNKK